MVCVCTSLFAATENVWPVRIGGTDFRSRVSKANKDKFGRTVDKSDDPGISLGKRLLTRAGCAN